MKIIMSLLVMGLITGCVRGPEVTAEDMVKAKQEGIKQGHEDCRNLILGCKNLKDEYEMLLERYQELNDKVEKIQESTNLK